MDPHDEAEEEENEPATVDTSVHALAVCKTLRLRLQFYPLVDSLLLFNYRTDLGVLRIAEHPHHGGLRAVGVHRADGSQHQRSVEDGVMRPPDAGE